MQWERGENIVSFASRVWCRRGEGGEGKAASAAIGGRVTRIDAVTGTWSLLRGRQLMPRCRQLSFRWLSGSVGGSLIPVRVVGRLAGAAHGFLCTRYTGLVLVFG